MESTDRASMGANGSGRIMIGCHAVNRGFHDQLRVMHRNCGEVRYFQQRQPAAK